MGQSRDRGSDSRGGEQSPPSAIVGAICVPHRNIGFPVFWKSLAALSKPAGTALMTSEGTGIVGQRNGLVRLALSQGAEWVLFVDDDHILPQNALERLMAHRVPVVGALFVTKKPPHIPTAKYRHANDDWRGITVDEIVAGGLRAVDGIGMGCTLIQREVLEAVGDPWFQGNQLRAGQLGEDLWFCGQARDKGFPVYVDCDLRIPHLTIASVIVTDDGRVEVVV